MESFLPFSEVNALAFESGHLPAGYIVTMLPAKDYDISSRSADNHYRCPATCEVYETQVFNPLMNLRQERSSHQTRVFNMLLGYAERAMFAMELKFLLRELDPALLLGPAPYRVIMSSYLSNVALGIVTPKGWHELKPCQTLTELYDDVM